MATLVSNCLPEALTSCLFQKEPCDSLVKGLHWDNLVCFVLINSFFPCLFHCVSVTDFVRGKIPNSTFAGICAILPVIYLL